MSDRRARTLLADDRGRREAVDAQPSGRRPRPWTLALVAVLATLVLVEVALRLYLGYGASPERFLRYASREALRQRHGLARLSPHRYLGFYPTPGYERGATRHDARGFRGDATPGPRIPGSFRIVCLGGSTTYSDGVEDNAHAYPRLLQEALHDRGYQHVEVVNAGVPGYSTLESVINLQFRVLELEPNLVVVYHGINDVLARLVWPPSAFRADHSGLWRFEPPPEASWPLEHSALLRVLGIRLGWLTPHASYQRTLAPVAPTSVATELGRQLQAATYPQGLFRQTSVRALLESNSHRHFERNLRSLVAMARSHRVVPLLVTFASSPDLPSPSVVQLPAVRAALREQNGALVALGRELSVPWVDLAAELDGRPPLFTDGVHFNIEGNRRRARILADFIAVQPWFPPAAHPSAPAATDAIRPR